MTDHIISISKDQNTITHESGIVTEFQDHYENCCGSCFYKNRHVCLLPCTHQDRIDNREGIFKLVKPQEI